MLNRRHGGGFSLIELMIGLALLAALLALGAPEIFSYLRNAKVRAAAENLYAGMQLARAEAVRRNAWVQFIVTSDDPTAANVATVTPAADGIGPNWLIRQLDCVPNYTFVEGKAMVEGAGATGAQAMIAGDDGAGNGVAVVTFNGFGQSVIVSAACTTTPAPKAIFRVSGHYSGIADPAYADRCNGIRCLNIQVSSGGQSRMCDPAVTDTTDTRYCS
jgi:type IV fimbrial biogenesis protein FimT